MLRGWKYDTQAKICNQRFLDSVAKQWICVSYSYLHKILHDQLWNNSWPYKYTPQRGHLKYITYKSFYYVSLSPDEIYNILKFSIFETTTQAGHKRSIHSKINTVLFFILVLFLFSLLPFILLISGNSIVAVRKVDRCIVHILSLANVKSATLFWRFPELTVNTIYLYNATIHSFSCIPSR